MPFPATPKLYVLLGLLLLLCACKKKLPFHAIEDRRLREAVSYPEDAYFVFTDSATQQIDSFFGPITNTHAEGEVDASGNRIAEWETIDCAIGDGTFPSSVSVNALLFYGGGKDGLDKAFLTYRTYAISTPGKPDYNGYLLRLPFIVGDSIQTGIFHSKNIAHYAQYAVAGKEYKDVYETNSYAEHQNGLDLFYSTESGLVKFVLHDTDGAARTWRLTHSNVVR